MYYLGEIHIIDRVPHVELRHSTFRKLRLNEKLLLEWMIEESLSSDS